MKKKEKGIAKFIFRLQARIALNKKAFIFYSVLRILVILTGIRCIFTKNYESLMLCVLSLVLFLLPAFFEEWFRIEIPPLFEIIIYCFIYAAEILGEVKSYYVTFPGWDTMLHTMNGFLCAAIGFSAVELFNRNSRKLWLSPGYMAIMAFCFSMTVGVLWEFFEFGADKFLGMDMQKDFIVKEINSVSLNENLSQKVVHVKDINRTIVETANGETIVIEGGYLDIGINDTMKDLFVNFIGAVVFSLMGYFYEKFYVRNKEENPKLKLAGDLMWRNVSKKERKQQEVAIEENLNWFKKKKKEPEPEKNE